MGLQRFADKIDQRSDKLLAYLQDGPQLLEQLVARVNPGSDARQRAGLCR